MVRSTHERLLKRVRQVTHELFDAEKTFLERFLSDSNSFQLDLEQFLVEYENQGPMTEGLSAEQANERLNRFESKFVELWKRYENRRSGEQLFGLEETSFPRLQTIHKQLNYFKRLYGLYSQVLETIERYKETLWKDIQLERINEEIQEFQSFISSRRNIFLESRI